MKIHSILSNVIFVLCILFISACSTDRPSEPVIIIQTPTPVTPSETVVPNPTTAPLEPTQPAPLPTEVVISKIDPTPITPVDPPSTPDECTLPEPPNGVSYIVYSVQAGDTLFTIGQKTRPNMTVADIATANCLADVNRIEVGQQLMIWHSPTSGQLPAVTTLNFSSEEHFEIATYSGPLAFGEHIFKFNGFAGEYLSLRSRVGQSPAILYTLEKASDSSVVGSVHSTDRYYIDPQIQGRQFQLPEDGDYQLRVTGQAGSLLDFSLVVNNEKDSVVGDLQRIQFPAGYTDTFVTGTSELYLHDRYVFSASAGQLLDLELIKSTNTYVLLEDSSLNIFHTFDPKNEPKQITLPDTGDYILTAVTYGLRNGQSPNYTFNLSITDPVVIEPIPDAETLAFNEIMNGWLGGGATGTLDETGSKTFTFYLGGERHLGLVDRSGSSLNFRIEKADGTTQVGSVSTIERHYLDPASRGRGFTLPETAQYLLHVSGNPGTAFDFGMVWGGIPHPILGAPERIQFATGSNTTGVTGENLPGEMDRYMVWANAGQTMTIEIPQNTDGTLDIHVQVENGSEDVILQAVPGANQVTLPAEGDYMLTVWQPKGEVYGHGPYEFIVTIK